MTCGCNNFNYFSENQLTKFKLWPTPSPQLPYFPLPDDFCDAFCVAGSGGDRPHGVGAYNADVVAAEQIACICSLAGRYATGCLPAALRTHCEQLAVKRLPDGGMRTASFPLMFCRRRAVYSVPVPPPSSLVACSVVGLALMRGEWVT